LFEIDFGAKNIRSLPLPVARIRKIFSARSGDFHRKIFGAGEKVAQLNRTGSKRSHDKPSQETNDAPPHSFFCCGREQFRIHPEIRLAGEGRNKSNSCLSLLANIPAV
jgi:hypothetical protein